MMGWQGSIGNTNGGLGGRGFGGMGDKAPLNVCTGAIMRGAAVTKI